jgi:hypothetical protein
METPGQISAEIDRQLRLRAGSARTAVASGRTGVWTKASIPARARNRVYRPWTRWWTRKGSLPTGAPLRRITENPEPEMSHAVSWTACWAMCGPRGLRTQAPRRVQVHGNFGATIVSEEPFSRPHQGTFANAPIAELGSGGFSAVRRAAAFSSAPPLSRQAMIWWIAAFDQNHADPVASAWDLVAAAASRP